MEKGPKKYGFAIADTSSGDDNLVENFAMVIVNAWIDRSCDCFGIL